MIVMHSVGEFGQRLEKLVYLHSQPTNQPVTNSELVMVGGSGGCRIQL